MYLYIFWVKFFLNSPIKLNSGTFRYKMLYSLIESWFNILLLNTFNLLFLLVLLMLKCWIDYFIFFTCINYLWNNKLMFTIVFVNSFHLLWFRKYFLPIKLDDTEKACMPTKQTFIGIKIFWIMVPKISYY